MTKTKEQIQEMIATIDAELKRLPPENAFGGSNASDIAELVVWKGCLDGYLATGNTTDRDVSDWIAGEWSPLNDMV